MNIFKVLHSILKDYKWVPFVFLTIITFYITLVLSLVMKEKNKTMYYINKCNEYGGTTLNLSNEVLCMDSEVFEGIFIEIGEGE